MQLASSSPKPSVDLGSVHTSSSTQPAITPSTTPATEKGQDQLAPVNVVDVETEEVAKMAQLKRKKKEKEQEKKGGKEKETST